MRRGQGGVARGTIRGRLEALHDGRLPTPPELLATDEEALRGIGLSRGRFTADGVLMLTLRPRDIWPAADLALRRAVARVWGLDGPLTVAEVDALGERFPPWRTLAAVYLLGA
ncbi:MAG TPA: hypothetical protein VF752_11175 [Thermoleophilaceae bacterium]